MQANNHSKITSKNIVLTVSTSVTGIIIKLGLRYARFQREYFDTYYTVGSEILV